MDIETHALPDIDFGARQAFGNSIDVGQASRPMFLRIGGTNHNFTRLPFGAPGSNGFEVNDFSRSVDLFEIERRRL
mgnify:CR=1 FL=1